MGFSVLDNFKTTTIKKALSESEGKISVAAAVLKVAPGTLTKYIKKHPVLQDSLVDIQDGLLDIAESELMKAIKAGKAWAICFMLKCQGKNRGWVERQEHTGKEREDLTINIIPAKKVSNIIPIQPLKKEISDTKLKTVTTKQ